MPSKRTKTILAIISIFIIVLFLFLTNKQEEKPKNTFKIIKNSTINHNEKLHNYQLLRLKGKNAPSYAIYYPKNSKETILLIMPYERIDWSGEKIDSSHWGAQSISQATDSAYLFLLNNFSTLLVYPRFYIGGDINNDIEDVIAGLNFLENKTEKIGILGRSWGGFEAIYAATNSKTKPLVGAAFYPPSEIKSWIEWTYSTNDSFFNPHQERIKNATQGDYTNWSHKYIKQKIQTDFLIIHAHEDTLVPFNQSYNLARISSNFQPMWIHKVKTNLSHGEQQQGETFPFEETIANVYLTSKLTNRQLIILIDKDAMRNYINGLAESKKQGEDINWSIPLFEIMFKQNIIYYDIKSNSIMTSDQLKTEFQKDIPLNISQN